MELLGDRYELGDPLGHGRSTVYRATDRRLQRNVAIKRVQLVAGQEDAEQVRVRALREAQASARLNNPASVAVYDVVEEAGAIWLVMELVDGPSLAALVSDRGPLPHPHAARIGLQVLTALEAAHLVGVVHRDVKPANVLVLDGDRAKLTDFGVATIRDESRVTMTGLIVGSPSYMAPEQATGADITPATDLWALGAMLYFAVEGEPPFHGGSALATASAVVHGQPRPQQRPGPLSPLLARLLTKDPAARPSAGAVRATLTRVGDSERSSAASTLVAPVLPAPPTVDPDPAPVDPGPEIVAAPTPEPAPSGPPPVDPAALDPDVVDPDPGEPAPAAGAPETTAVHTGPEPDVGAPDVGEPDVDAPDVDAPDVGAPDVGERGAAGPDPERDPEPAPAPILPPTRTPGDRVRPDGGTGPRSRLVVLAAAAVVLLLVVIGVSALRGGDGGDGDETAGDGGPASTTTVADSTTTEAAPETTAPPPPTTVPSGLPAGWSPFQDPAGAYTIGVPPGWQPSQVASNRIDFRDPATGSFVRVEWTGTPGPDAAGAWRDLEPSFAANNANYEPLGISPVAYRDYPAALWEFRHGGGETLHTGNLGFVTNGRGYALMLRTPESQWAAMQPVFEQFKQSFQPT